MQQRAAGNTPHEMDGERQQQRATVATVPTTLKIHTNAASSLLLRGALLLLLLLMVENSGLAGLQHVAALKDATVVLTSSPNPITTTSVSTTSPKPKSTTVRSTTSSKPKATEAPNVHNHPKFYFAPLQT